jgi:hypothetical protein
VDQPLEAARRRPRPAAGRDHPAARHADLQRADGRRLGRPLAAALTGLGNWLNGLTGTSAVLLGIILGLMMCFDLGGPVNKAAYVFATTGPGRRQRRPAGHHGHGHGRRAWSRRWRWR